MHQEEMEYQAETDCLDQQVQPEDQVLWAPLDHRMGLQEAGSKVNLELEEVQEPQVQEGRQEEQVLGAPPDPLVGLVLLDPQAPLVVLAPLVHRDVLEVLDR